MAKQKEPKKKGRLQLDRSHMIAMLSQPDFYEAVPQMAYLQEVALASYAAFRQSEIDGCCGGKWDLMRGVVDAFFLKLLEFKRDAPAYLELIRDYLSQKKGYRVHPIVIYYRRSKKQGKIAKFEF
jgi:hypothetical protein